MSTEVEMVQCSGCRRVCDMDSFGFKVNDDVEDSSCVKCGSGSFYPITAEGKLSHSISGDKVKNPGREFDSLSKYKEFVKAILCI